MDNLVWAIYFIDTLTSEGGHALAGSLIIMSVSLLYVVGKFDSDMPDFHLIMPIKSLITLGALLCIYGAIMPSKDTAYKMLAAYGVTEIAQNEEVQRLSGKSLQVLEKAMDEYLNEGEQ